MLHCVLGCLRLLQVLEQVVPISELRFGKTTESLNLFLKNWEEKREKKYDLPFDGK